MTNSFLKSLPSHKKKERQRKLRHQRRVGSQVADHPKVDDDNAGGDHSQNWPVVEQKPRFPLGDAEQQSANVDESPYLDGEHSESSLLSDSSSSVVPATELQYPPVPTVVNSMDELSNTAPPRHSARKGCHDEMREMFSPLSDRSGKVSNFLESARSKSCDFKRENEGGMIMRDETLNEKSNEADAAVSNDGLKKTNVSYNSEENRLNDSIVEQSTLLNQRQPHQVALEDKSKAPNDWVLTSTDIGSCIDEINSAISSHNGRNEDDLFDDVDVESFQSTLEGFKRYIISLGQQTSDESVELKEFHPTEQVFVIFERGMGVDHCNAGFIHDMIDHIVSGIEDSKRGDEGVDQTDHEPTRLHHLARCMETIFGIHFDEDSIHSRETMTSFDTSLISITINNGTTKLLFRREPERSRTSRPANRPALPAFLSDVSKIFEHYCKQNALPLLSQLDSARETLKKTRQGAIKLQKTALDLQDQLQSAKLDVDEAYSRQSALETELSRQKYEFDKRAESFERVKEHYKMLADRKEKELTEIKRKLEQKAFVPETTFSMASEKLPRHQEKKSYESSKREQAHDGDDSRHTPHFSKRGRLRESVNEDAEESSLRKKSRVDMEPQVSTYSINTKSIVYESPPARSSQESALHSNSKHGSKPKKSESAITSEQRKQRYSDTITQRLKRHDSATDRNPLGPLTVNSFVGHSASDSACREEKTKAPKIDSQLRCKDASLTKKYDEAIATSSTSKNPYLKKLSQGDDSDSYDFKYQEVVRGKDARQSLPAYECEQCRKFNDAVYAQTGADMPGRAQMVKECSRHRARHVPDLTPAGFWDMDFADEK